MGEKSAIVMSANTKNEDCYFYYYSSCSKGNACPFRHEPAALRNETMCIYWRSGNCAKENCIFRHMEITKKRDKIQCWWETQPGGCKKPHCPFQHQNILDHPREEDIKRTPDLILPVKTDGGIERNGSERQVIPPPRVPPRVHTPPVTPTVITPTPIIVSLFDGESDTESTGATPQKKQVQQLSAQTEWELQKLRQIQAHEANLIGYCFQDDDDDIEQEYEEGQIEEEEEVEEEEMVVEEIEVDEGDAAHRRLTSTGINDFIGDLRTQLTSRHTSKVKTKHDTSESDLRERLLKSRSEKIASDFKNEFPKSRLAGRLGKIATRALEETLGRKELKRLNRQTSDNVPVTTVLERMQVSPKKKKSLLERLGTKTSKESGSDSDPFSRLGPKNIDTKSRLMKENESENLTFTIKSLADIKAEKERNTNKRHVTLKPTTKHESREVPNRISMNSRISQNLSRERGSSMEIKTLAQIRADKQQVQMSPTEVKPNRKRAISHISFDDNDNKSKKIRNEMRNFCSTEVKSPQTVRKVSLMSSINTEPKIITTNTSVPVVEPTLGLRKISVKKPPIKSAEVEAPIDTAEQKKLTVKQKDETNDSVSLQKRSTQKSPKKSAELGAPIDTAEQKKLTVKQKEETNDSVSLQKRSTRKSPKKSAELGAPIDTAEQNKLTVKQQDDTTDSVSLQKRSSRNRKSDSKKSSPKNNKPSKVIKDKKSPKQLKQATVASKSVTVPSKLSRNDSILDEEEALLLGGDLTELDSDEEIDEDALLL